MLAGDGALMLLPLMLVELGEVAELYPTGGAGPDQGRVRCHVLYAHVDLQCSHGMVVLMGGCGSVFIIYKKLGSRTGF